MLGLGLNIQPRVVGVATDPDAQTFFTNTGITDATIKTAINNHVLGLKADSLWTLVDAIYPLVGGSATTHKYNLKDPRDLDDAFRILWSGGLTHASTGVTGNAVNGYGETYINPSTIGTNVNQSFGVYVRTNVAGSQCEFGGYVGSNYCQLSTRWGNTIQMDVNGYGSTIANTDSRGIYIGSRLNNTTVRALYNGTFANMNNATNVGRPNVTLNLFRLKNYGGFSGKEISYAFFSRNSFSDSQLTALSTRILELQTALSRNV